MSIQIIGSAVIPNAGQNFDLTCSVSGADVATYRWVKNGSYSLNETGSFLSFNPLKLFDAGQYMCIANISSKIFNISQSIIIRGENYNSSVIKLTSCSYDHTLLHASMQFQVLLMYLSLVIKIIPSAQLDLMLM